MHAFSLDIAGLKRSFHESFFLTKYEKPALPHQIKRLVILMREMREGRLNYFTGYRSCQALSHGQKLEIG